MLKIKLFFLTFCTFFVFYSNAQIVFDIPTKTITGYTGSPAATYVIPDNVNGVPVLAIGASAFSGKTTITTLFIPNTVTSIAASAFSGCTGIASITLGSGLITMGNSAFSGCTALKKIYAYPSSPVDLSSSTLAFSGVTGCTLYVTAASSAAYTTAAVWSSFTRSSTSAFVFSGGTITGYTGLVPAALSIPALNGATPVTTIGTSAFLNQTGIASVTMPSSVTSIGANSFQNCSGITSLTIGFGVTSIGSNSFSGCTALTAVTIPNSVTTINSAAFANCSNLASLSFLSPAVITSIGDYAFQTNKLTSVTIPNSVTYLGINQFRDCSLLTNITLGSSIQTIGATCFMGTKITSLVIPNSVTSIGTSVCSGVTTLATLTLGSGLTTFGATAFNACTGLTSIYANMTTPVDLTAVLNTFNLVNKTNCALYVPAASLATYQAAAGWRDFVDISPMASSGQTNSFSYNYTNIRFDSIDKSFASPPNQYRLTQYLNDPGFNQDTVSVLKSYGIGGVLTSASYNNYLVTEASCSQARNNVDMAAKNGLRAQISDEKGYPSGAAAGMVVDGHPEYEARGVVRITQKGSGPVNISIALPDTISFFRASLASIVNGEADYEHAKQVSITNNRIDTIGLTGTWQLSVFGVEILNKNTQAQSTMLQFGTTGHYPSLLNKDAVTRFINLTHQSYANHIINFNQKVDLFYSNEPNLMSTYFQYDGSRAQYAYIPWDAGLASQFSLLNGYDLLPRLDALFEGSSTGSKTIRTHFYQTVANLFSTNYTDQIRDWCVKNGVQSAGHLLLEEYLACHVIHYGDFMQAIRQFDVIGCDVPVARANISDWHYWMPKFISSASYLENKNAVTNVLIDPIIGFGTTDLSPAITDLKRTVNMCFLTGMNQYSSYMPYTNYTAQVFSDFTNYMARISLMLRGAQNEAPIAMYYPIETSQANYIVTPYNWQQSVRNYSYLQATLDRMAKDLLSNGLDYNYVTADAILNASLNGNYVKIGTHQYSSIVMPRVEVISLGVLNKLKSFSGAGIPVYWVDTLPSLGTKNSEHAQVAAISKTLTTNNAPLSELLKLKDKEFSVNLSSSAGNLWMSRSTRDNKRMYYLINESPSEITITATSTKTDSVQIYNPNSGQINKVKLPLSQKIAAYESVFLVEKMIDTITDSSIIHNDLIKPLRLFPNPASTVIHIKLPAQYIGSTIKIMSVYGQEIDRVVITTELFTKNIARYNPGCYFIQIAGKTVRFVKR